MTHLTIYAVQQIDVHGVITVDPADIRGLYDQAHDVMSGRLVHGEQRVVAMTTSGTWVPVVTR